MVEDVGSTRRSVPGPYMVSSGLEINKIAKQFCIVSYLDLASSTFEVIYRGRNTPLILVRTALGGSIPRRGVILMHEYYALGWKNENIRI